MRVGQFDLIFKTTMLTINMLERIIEDYSLASSWYVGVVFISILEIMILLMLGVKKLKQGWEGEYFLFMLVQYVFDHSLPPFPWIFCYIICKLNIENKIDRRIPTFKKKRHAGKNVASQTSNPHHCSKHCCYMFTGVKLSGRMTEPSQNL